MGHFVITPELGTQFCVLLYNYKTITLFLLQITMQQQSEQFYLSPQTW